GGLHAIRRRMHAMSRLEILVATSGWCRFGFQHYIGGQQLNLPCPAHRGERSRLHQTNLYDSFLADLCLAWDQVRCDHGPDGALHRYLFVKTMTALWISILPQ